MLQPGLTGSASLIVDESVSAKTIGSGTLDVLSTPIMIALMEKAAWTSIANHLDTGCGSVGIEMNVKHSAPTPLGVSVTATATLSKVEGKQLFFLVTAADASGPIGEGTHTRFIIENEKFQEKANRKQ